jgi:MAE_28990/MAE_18760-like HEPN
MATVDRILEEDLDWREAELASLKAEVAIAGTGSVKHRALLRALWAMLYAHYEGFSVFAWATYLEEVGKIGLIRRDLDPRLAHFSLVKRFREMKHTCTTWEFFEFCEREFPDLMISKVEFTSGLDAESNLWPDKFTEKCSIVGLDCPSIHSGAKHIQALVARRNEIAHGKKMFIRDLLEYQTYEDAALSVMYELAICISENVDKLQAGRRARAEN